MTDAADREKSEKLKKSNWRWPELVATSLVGAAAVAFRGCWHGKMGWPVAERGYSYQVCLKCGAMRLFDENTFSSHGPFRYDLDQLIAWEESRKTKPHPVADVQRPAS